ncbi:MAG: glycosyltransferase, partial [Armatimonadia bacterium]|nr:glycosyltransferase [Armatimonadia bacterium]
MHILYLHQYFCTPEGSSGTRSYEMARRLVAAGHRVTMVCSAANLGHLDLPAGRSDLEIDGIHVIALNVAYSNRMSHLERIKAFYRFAWGARQAGRAASGVDVVFATSTPLTIAYPGVGASRRHRCPMVFEVRDLWPELPIAVGALRDPVSKA